MKQILKKLNTKREGATLVTVVIATAFLIAIGVVILAASSKYLVSVYMDRNSNENLYSAEGILSEVRSGLLQYASEAGAAAYKEVMEDYNKVFTKTDPNDSTKKLVLSKRDRFARLYIEGIIDKIAPSDYVWNDADVNLAAVTGGAVIAHPVSIEKVAALTQSEEKQEAITSVAQLRNRIAGATTPPEPPAFSADNGDLCFSICYSTSKGYYLVLRNLVVDYKDEAGYRSTVQTDIQMTVPDYHFDGGSTPEATNRFLLISDGQLKIGDAGSDTTDDNPAAFSGDIYTGGGVGSLEAGGDVKDDASAILVERKMAAHFNCGLLISRGSLEANTGAHVKITGPKVVTTEGGIPTVKDTMNGKIYLKNIFLKPSKGEDGSDPSVAVAPADGEGTVFTLKAESYIENDLDIRDAGTTVTLGGVYRGYSYSKENGTDDALSDVTTAKSQSDYSSAILINGMGTTLKSEDLSELQLAGRTFVKRTGTYEDYNDIMMGESVAVKTNQIAYLVPDKYVRRKHNPLTQAEASNWDGSDYFDPQSLVNLSDMKDDEKLWNYLDENHPVTANYKPAEGEGSTPYVFLFLNFKDQNSANNYFREFYRGTYISEPDPDDEDEGAGQPGDVTKKDLLSRAKAYIVSEDGGITLDPTYFLIAGNIIRHYETKADGSVVSKGLAFQSPNYYDGLGKPILTNLDFGRQYGYQYVSLQKTLTTSETETSMRLIPSKKNFKDRTIGEGNTREEVPPVADGKVIKFSGIVSCGPKQEPQTGAKVYSGDADNLSASSYLGEDGRLLLVNKGNITIDTNCSGLIIGKDIRISAGVNFKGLIVASGNVTVAGSCNLESDQILVKKLMTYAKGDPDLSKMFGLDDPETHNSVVPDECCRYLNWIKNTY